MLSVVDLVLLYETLVSYVNNTYNCFFSKTDWCSKSYPCKKEMVTPYLILPQNKIENVCFRLSPNVIIIEKDQLIIQKVPP